MPRRDGVAVTDGFEWAVAVLRPIQPVEVALLARTGVDRVIVHVPWRWAEKRRGVFDRDNIDHFLAPLRDAGFPVMGVLGPGMPHLVPDWVLEAGGVDAPEYRTWFSTYCAWAAESLPWIDVFRVEDNLNAAFLWDGLRTRRRRGTAWRDRSFVRRLLAESLAAVRSVRPDASLRVTVHAGIPGWRRTAKEWSAEMPLDRLGLTLQPCMVLPDPTMASRIGEAVEQARATVRASGRPDVSVEVARTGYGTHKRAFSPRRQREYLVAAGGAARAAGAAGFGWWALRDQAHDDPILRYWTPTQERHMGLLYYDSTPKPAMDELRVLATGDRFGEGRGPRVLI